MARYWRIFLVLSLLTAVVLLSSCTSSSTASSTTAASSTITTSSLTTQSKTVTPALVTMWHMDEGTGNFLLDSTNNHNDGLINGATWVTGIKGFALSFNGDDNWVMVTKTFIFHQTTDATLSMWIKPADSMHRPIFWTRGDDSDRDRFHIFSGWNNKTGFGFDYRAANSDPHYLIEIDVPSNQWTHIVITRSGDDYYLFRNGQLVGQVTDVNPNLPTYTGSWFIGRRNSGETLYKGLIDEVAIYDCALSPEEILDIYQE